MNNIIIIEQSDIDNIKRKIKSLYTAGRIIDSRNTIYPNNGIVKKAEEVTFHFGVKEKAIFNHNEKLYEIEDDFYQLLINKYNVSSNAVLTYHNYFQDLVRICLKELKDEVENQEKKYIETIEQRKRKAVIGGVVGVLSFILALIGGAIQIDFLLIGVPLAVICFFFVMYQLIQNQQGR